MHRDVTSRGLLRVGDYKPRHGIFERGWFERCGEVCEVRDLVEKTSQIHCNQTEMKRRTLRLPRQNMHTHQWGAQNSLFMSVTRGAAAAMAEQ